MPVGRLQFFLHVLQFGDVGVGAEPLHDVSHAVAIRLTSSVPGAIAVVQAFLPAIFPVTRTPVLSRVHRRYFPLSVAGGNSCTTLIRSVNFLHFP